SGMPPRIRATFSSVWKSSASAKRSPVSSLIARATVVLPTPDTPMTTMCRVGGRSPVMDGAVLQAAERQVRLLVREARRGLLVELHAEPGLLARVQVAVGEGERLPEHLVRGRAVPHVLLDAEVVDRQVQVERGGHADGRDVGRAVDAGLDLVLRRVVEELAHRRDPAGVGDGRADVVDELLADQRLVVPDGVE